MVTMIAIWIIMCVLMVHIGAICIHKPHGLTGNFKTGVNGLEIGPISKLTGEVNLPGSKSLSNRALLLAAVSRGSTTLDNLLDCDDTRYMAAALKDLGASLELNWEKSAARVRGMDGPFHASTEKALYLGNAGTAMRSLVAMVSAGAGRFSLDGTARMRERPIQDLIDALRQLGVTAECSSTGCPPVRIDTQGLQGGVARVSGQISSQYLSALLMATPFSSRDVRIEIVDRLISAPYVALTVRLMKQFGVHVERVDNSVFIIPGGQTYQSPGAFYVEGDASAASYFLAAGAIADGPVTVRGCGSQSVQGDIRFAKILEQMGAIVSYTPTTITVHGPSSGEALRAVDVDCGDIPDAAMTLAIVALFAKGTTTIRNIQSWRLKETDRLHAMATELRRLGVEVREGRDWLQVRGSEGRGLRDGVAIETYDDHRMAMAFSLVACAEVQVVIRDPGCTAKTFPAYFSTLSSLLPPDQRH